MKNLSIDKTERSPKVYFDYIKHEMEISGEAYPENNDEFYRPIFESLHAYLSLENDVTINFKFRMIYFNSSSARMLMKIFEFLDSPATTNEIIYSLDMGGYSTSISVHLNRDHNDSNGTSYNSTPISTLTLMEIAQ